MHIHKRIDITFCRFWSSDLQAGLYSLAWLWKCPGPTFYWERKQTERVDPLHWQPLLLDSSEAGHCVSEEEGESSTLIIWHCLYWHRYWETLAGHFWGCQESGGCEVQGDSARAHHGAGPDQRQVSSRGANRRGHFTGYLDVNRGIFHAIHLSENFWWHKYFTFCSLHYYYNSCSD